MLTDTSASPYAQMTSMSPGSSELSGASPLALLRDRAVRITIPTMGAIMFDPAVAHAYENFRIAAGEIPGRHAGPPFMDGDLYKWLESATITAAETKDEDLFARIARAAVEIGRAQQPDGYLHTKTIIAHRHDPDVRPLAQRMDFETYNLGHLMTFACVHHRLTGDDTYLRIATRAADYLIGVAEREPGRLADCNICPSHYMEWSRSTGPPRSVGISTSPGDCSTCTEVRAATAATTTRTSSPSATNGWPSGIRSVRTISMPAWPTMPSRPVTRRWWRR